MTTSHAKVRALVWTLAMLIGVVTVDRGLTGQAPPLPDKEMFLREVRKHLETDYTLQSSYAYTETRTEQHLDGRGRSTKQMVKVFENYPGFPGEGRYERLIAEDGRPVPAKDLERQDRERQKKAQEYASRLASRPEQERTRQNREWEKARKETAEIVDDIFRVFNVEMLRREQIGGHSTIAFALSPRADARPRTRDGGMMRAFNVHAWVSESDHELVRLDVEAIKTLSIGLGFLARIHKGTQMSFVRERVNGEVWLPAKATYTASARVALLKMLRRAGTSEFSNYRKFTVDTSMTYASDAAAR